MPDDKPDPYIAIVSRKEGVVLRQVLVLATCVAFHPYCLSMTSLASELEEK